MKEFFKNVGTGAATIGRKIVKPAIGLTVAGVTTVALYLIGKKERKNTDDPDIETEGTEEEIEETEEDEEEEDESDESEEA